MNLIDLKYRSDTYHRSNPVTVTLVTDKIVSEFFRKGSS